MPNTDNISLLILRDQVDELNTNLRFVWNIYMGWFTVFLTINLTGLIYFTKENTVLNMSVAICLIISNIFGILTSLIIKQYSATTADSINVTREYMWSINTKSDMNILTKTPPAKIADLATIANSISMFLFVCVWLYILLK